MKVLLWLYRSQINSKGLMPIIMRITLNGKRINFPTQITIEEKAWDKNKQEVKGTDNLTSKYNCYLLTLKSRAWDFYNEKIKQGMPININQVKQYVLGNDSTQYTLMEAIDYQIESLRARIGNDIALGTVKNYQTVKSKVTAFLASKGLEDITLAELSHQFIYELDHFMRVKQNINNNGVVKNMQQLKRIVRVAMLNDWLEKDPFSKYQCKIIEPKRVHLTQEELKCMEELPLPSMRLTHVRDIFVFACYTGLAYADVSKLSSEHIHQINGRLWIILDRTKTKNQSTIPLLPKASEILRLYNKSKDKYLLPVISSQNLNKYLKEVTALAGIKKRLSFHAARHTFATTVTLNKGVDITTVSAMLGHKMLKTTQIYARVNMNKIANDIDSLLK